jgi:hypothetical protein
VVGAATNVVGDCVCAVIAGETGQNVVLYIEAFRPVHDQLDKAFIKYFSLMQ